MNPGEMLSERYEIVRELGRGGAGVTALARDTVSDRSVVVKLLHLGLLADWKSVELLQREASVLKGLHHDRIPAYIDYFSLETGDVPRFVLVREFIDGTSLQGKVEEGWRASEAQIRDIGARLARIVAYIHGVRPPVIHRDINPRNIIVREDGEVFLVDFGGVQDAIRVSTGATSTIVGTPGYTPMEQFVGRATVRSDLYAVAATILFLLTHRNPADLPVKEMKIDVPSIIEISSPALARLLADWLEPDESKRTIDIDEAIALLEETAPPPSSASRPASAGGLENPPHGSRIVRTAGKGIVSFLLPDPGGGSRRRGFAPFGFFWLVFIGFWTSGTFTTHAPLGMTLMSLPFWAMGIGMIAWVVSGMFGKLRIEIGREGLAYTRRVFFFSRRREVPLSDIGECRIEEGWSTRSRHHRDWGYGDGYRRRTSRVMTRRLSLDVGASTLSFGGGLSSREQEWLRDAINTELRRLRPMP